MHVINGLPAHVLLVHAMVVLAPLTALLEILCAILPAVRRRLVWLVLILALVTVYRIGDSGAQSVWGGVVKTTSR